MGDNLTKILVLLLLIIMSGYFSATETAFSSFNKTRMKNLAEQGNKRAALAVKISEDYDKMLSTILIGNNIVNIAAASIGTVLFVNIYGDIGATISTVVITIVVLVFAEITPKGVAKDCPEKLAIFSAPLLRGIMVLFTPLTFIFSAWKKLISKVFRLKSETKMSQSELLMLVEEVQQDGSIDENEGDLLKNAIEFTERRASDILTHRVDLEAVDIESSKQEIARVFAQSKFSRILAYEENIDHIAGVIHLKDFYDEAGITKKPLKEIITPAVFVMENERVDDILRRLQKEKSHIAVVVDEYGGTYGIVTMEDILEELVGEIWDEHDEVSSLVKKTGDNTYIIDGLEEMDDFCELFGLDDLETDSVSLGGWIMEQLEKIPEDGDSFEYETLSVKVLKTENHRVLSAEVKDSAVKKESEEE